MNNESNGILFRNAGRGYNKEDVNRYIEEMNIRFNAIEQEYQKKISELESSVSKNNGVADDTVISDGSDVLAEKCEALEKELAELKAKCKALEEAAAADNEPAEPAEKCEPQEVSALEEAPKEKQPDEDLSVKLGALMIETKHNADEMLKKAKEDADSVMLKAKESADSMENDAVLTSQLMVERVRKSVSALTADYTGKLSNLGADAVKEYSDILFKLKLNLKDIELNIDDAAKKAKISIEEILKDETKK